MRVSDFDFDLPDDLIAQTPPEVRGGSKLLVATTEPFIDTCFDKIIQQIDSGDLLVFNNTRVIKARLFGQKETGGKLEVLVERVLDDQTVLAHVRSSKSPKENTTILFEYGIVAKMLRREGALFVLVFSVESGTAWEILEKIGHIPLPPYIERQDDEEDETRYQTVYAKHDGAVAAPTAGLHFTENVLSKLQERGVGFAYVTLHVGAGTFQPVKVDDIKDHIMHEEWFNIPEETVSAISLAHQNGKRVWAVGTTSLRSLEAGAVSGQLLAGSQETDIFITPGYKFKVVDGLLTNFHLPKSTLLMLVSAFSGFDFIKKIYQHAIEQKYRFFSYGDAMLLIRKDSE